MHLLPILQTLRRHRTAATLIILEIALTCAIVCNAVFAIRERLARIDTPSGIAEDELVVVRIAATRKPEGDGTTRQDIAALQAVPGVRAVAATNQFPFGTNSWNSTVKLAPATQDGWNAAMYMGSPGLLDTLGVPIVAGRGFLPEEYARYDDVLRGKARVPSVIITRGLADRMFPGSDPIGRPIYLINDNPVVVVGVVEHLARPNEFAGPGLADCAFVMPVTMPSITYLVRVDRDRTDEVIAAVAPALDRVDPRRVMLGNRRFIEVRAEYFAKDRAMAYLLVGVSIALLVITALGIVGLASFWVQQRTRQIGIRRALGASRGDIVRYFQLENFLLATAGIALGMVLAYGINLLLIDSLHIGRLPAVVLPIGAVVLWLLGQIAVLAPALRAATIPPAVATRTV